MAQVRNFVRFLRSTPPLANWIGAITLLAWMFKALILDNILEPIRGMFELGHVIDGLFSAVVAGYVFYILFALLPDYQSRILLSPFISRKVKGIVGDCLGVITEIEHASNYKLPFPTATANEVLVAFTAVKTITPPRLVNLVAGVPVPANWLQFFMYRQERTTKSIIDLFDQSRFLDAELISILTNINECAFFRSVAAVPELSASNTDLSAWGHSFGQYLVLCRDLARWHGAHGSP